MPSPTNMSPDDMKARTEMAAMMRTQRLSNEVIELQALQKADWTRLMGRQQNDRADMTIRHDEEMAELLSKERQALVAKP